MTILPTIILVICVICGTPTLSAALFSLILRMEGRRRICRRGDIASVSRASCGLLPSALLHRPPPW